ncbi:uncharacterized protein K02A2.6-like [Haliotis rufescens]|uniref:uncharacterized protein K02A2.6-like n=1 Tax=Haliotis rufescens TaxID=6454 RepID=UPI00201EBF8C|nr:uncharacterized protein K02A2.6-like [Haliotis rufescens]
MILRLQKYHLDVRYKKGTEMYIADFLSRASLPLRKIEPTLKDYEIVAVSENISFISELENINAAECITVTDQRLDQIQRLTQQDVNLQTLKSTILAGWPKQREDTPVCVRDYWTFREEMSVQNGVLFKGSRIVNPPAMRSEMLQRLHGSHLEAEACIQSRARDVVYWPNMTVDIKDHVGQCTVCSEMRPKQQKETLVSHEVPERPWSKIGVDLFTLHNEEYLVQVDYHSDYWEVDKLTNTTSTSVVECMKAQFSRHGIPDTVVSDNGPQLTSREFAQFAKDWEFSHVTTSPYHSQSNGKAESAVKIAKNLIKKTQREVATQLLKPEVVDSVSSKKALKHRKAKLYYDSHAKQLPELTVGQPVRVQPVPSDTTGKWHHGTCVRQVSTRSYIVDIDGKEYRCNRKFLRSTSETTPPKQLPEVTCEIEPDSHITAKKTTAAKTSPVVKPPPSSPPVPAELP